MLKVLRNYFTKGSTRERVRLGMDEIDPHSRHNSKILSSLVSEVHRSSVTAPSPTPARPVGPPALCIQTTGPSGEGDPPAAVELLTGVEH
jgi:hypothetical protein